MTFKIDTCVGSVAGKSFYTFPTVGMPMEVVTLDKVYAATTIKDNDLSNEALRALAKTYRPPQSWYDEECDLF